MGRNAKPATHPRADLRWDAAREWWVAPDLEEPGKVWTWPPYADAWGSLRKEYDGHDWQQLPAREAWRAYTTGWPGARPVPRADRREATPVVLRVCLTAEESNAVAMLAGDAGLSVSAWLRSAVQSKLREPS